MEKVHALREFLATLDIPFGKGCVLFNAPIGIGPQFNSVANVLVPPSPPPVGCLVDLAAQRSQLIDAIVEPEDLRTDLIARLAAAQTKNRHFSTRRHGVPPV